MLELFEGKSAPAISSFAIKLSSNLKKDYDISLGASKILHSIAHTNDMKNWHILEGKLKNTDVIPREKSESTTDECVLSENLKPLFIFRDGTPEQIKDFIIKHAENDIPVRLESFLLCILRALCFYREHNNQSISLDEILRCFHHKKIKKLISDMNENKAISLPLKELLIEVEDCWKEEEKWGMSVLEDKSLEAYSNYSFRKLKDELKPTKIMFDEIPGELLYLEREFCSYGTPNIIEGKYIINILLPELPANNSSEYNVDLADDIFSRLLDTPFLESVSRDPGMPKQIMYAMDGVGYKGKRSLVSVFLMDDVRRLL